MRIHWHGHACFEISNEVTLVTDPHDGKSLGIREPSVKADIVLVSHEHFDHNSARTVKSLNTKVVSGTVARTESGVQIKGFPSFHDDSGGERRGENTIFRFIMDGIVFCHLGDLGHLLDDDTIRAIGPVDILFVPVGDVFTIGPAKAWELIQKVRPKVAVPMHYRVGGLSLSIQPIEPFLEFAGDAVVKVGNEIDIEKDELPGELTVWVFTL
jgi:L-ascorbate metabolism protein UlaG (beta-lactamase superfamily)